MAARRARYGVALGIALALVLSACVATNPTGQELKGRAEREPANREFLNGTVAANNAFAADLYRSVIGNRGNYMLSPYAVLTALAMARSGSAGTTRAQLDAVLHAALATDLDGGLNTVRANVDSRSGEKRSDIRKGRVNVEIAAALWGQRGTHVKDDFLNLLARNYGTGFRVSDFRSDPENGRQAINNWASGTTDAHIQELVPRGEVTQYTRFLAAAAAYLEAPWQLPFDPAKTRTEPFTRADGQTADVRMMQLVAPDGFRYAEGDGWQAVELPYLGDELVLDIVLPAAGTFAAFEQSLTSDRIRDITAALERRPLDVHLPQFQFTTAMDLRDPLTAMGLTDAFARTADFSGITSDEMLSLSDVIYQGFFGIDERGTDAPPTATVQAVQEPPGVGVESVSVNRPFVFFVRDRATGLVLMIGRVVQLA